MANPKSVELYVVLTRSRRWHRALRVVRASPREPDLKRGECAVKLSLSVPDEAFEPVLQGPSLAFEVGQVLRAPVAGKAVS